MICRRCLLRAVHRPYVSHLNARKVQQAEPSISPFLSRSFRTTPRALQQSISVKHAEQSKGRQPPFASSPESHQPSSATSTSAAQPFSTPLTPSPSAEGVVTPKKSTTAPVKISSVPAGTVLKGLNYLKNKQDPVALPDEEYPSWLWSCISSAAKQGKDLASTVEGDLYSKSRKQRRLAAKRLRKLELLNAGVLDPPVPMEEQSIDLPRGIQEGFEARENLTEAMRKKRRATIKETNFLRSMR